MNDAESPSPKSPCEVHARWRLSSVSIAFVRIIWYDLDLGTTAAAASKQIEIWGDEGKVYSPASAITYLDQTYSHIPLNGTAKSKACPELVNSA